ncbi:hypothetical protein G3I40_45950 [Streptomyces sp. SID14478]|uniref:hypothetical protein n=1 Tax=Streptomyces sp. SID14478 TaxID=2706073 RepID=UPI0013DE8E59|nr:hypothetical protein [Streptomyces sp. SID14478]NEB82506.1 hypothetical protein [Streptomyces sp. SID14478]
MLQNYRGQARVFPGVSARRPDASIQGLRTEGAFVVDADRAARATRRVRVHSEAGAPVGAVDGEAARTVSRSGRFLPQLLRPCRAPCADSYWPLTVRSPRRGAA